MHNAEAAIEPALYDHEDDIVRSDRVAADWGADEVFASVPRRRFRGDRHVMAGAASRRAVPRRVSGPAVEDDLEAAERAAWLAGTEADLGVGAIDEPVADGAADMRPAALTAGVTFDQPTAWAEAPVDPAGRRTVTITGHPGQAAHVPRTPATARRRPARTVDERIGSRPDRVAGWSFGMGILLIVVAAFS